MTIERIFLPTRPQPDTIVAIFLLRTFGQERFPGIEHARVEVQHAISPEETFDVLLQKGILAIDVGSGPFDHHGTDFCATELVANYLGIKDNPSLTRLIQYARRDDVEGKGTLSTDPIDRSFGLSGLIASLNKKYIDNAQKVVETALPLIEAHYFASKEHHIDLPKDIEHQKRTGTYQEIRTQQGKKKLKIVYVISDKPSMPTFLRSQQGAQADVVVQKSEQTNHICVLTKQDRKIDLSKAMALIRLREAELQGIELHNDLAYLEKTGRIDEIPYWYFDPATVSLLNGGAHNRQVPESRISWEEIKSIVRVGIELAHAEPVSKETETYYLSLNIPEPFASQIANSLSTKNKDIKIHDSKNLHVTLEYFGKKTPQEAKAIAATLAEALGNKKSIQLELQDTLLKVGAPEGYDHAWYLALGEEKENQYIYDLRKDVLQALNMPTRGKELHITLASNRPTQSHTFDNDVQFVKPFSIMIPISEITLMQSIEKDGRRTYSPYIVYNLTYLDVCDI